jgi:hypothetical protein
MRFLFILATASLWFVIESNNASGQKNPQITQIRGKTVEEWIKQIPSKDPSKGEEAIRTILMFGPDRAMGAVPIVISELKNPGRNLDLKFRVMAVMSLGITIGGAEKPDPQLTSEAVAVLMRFSEDPQAIVRYRAAEALGRLDQDAKRAIPKIIILTKDRTTWEIREAATTALGNITRHTKVAPSDEVFEVLISRLGDSAFPVRLAAVKSLIWVGTPANPKTKSKELKALKTCTLTDSDPTIRIWTNMAIMQLQGKGFPFPKLLP